eukprot:1068339-Pelagomonas_calceolata.AAC.3
MARNVWMTMSTLQAGPKHDNKEVEGEQFIGTRLQDRACRQHAPGQGGPWLGFISAETGKMRVINSPPGFKTLQIQSGTMNSAASSTTNFEHDYLRSAGMVCMRADIPCTIDCLCLSAFEWLAVHVPYQVPKVLENSSGNVLWR